MKGMISWFAENHVAANLLMIFFIIVGVSIGVTIKLEVFPETSMDKILISTVYPGAAPAEVEEGIVRRIEEKIAGLPGIKKMDSMAREGYGQVMVEVISDWDVKKLLDDIKSEVDRITTFPEEAEEAVVRQLTIQNQVINVVVFGDVPEAALKNLTENVKDDITGLPEVTLAQIFGTRPTEIHIEVSEETLRRYGLSLGMVSRAVAGASLDLPAGTVKTKGGDILIRTKGRRYFAKDYADVAIITRPDGSQVTLGQIAKLSDDFQDLELKVRFKGKPAGVVSVYRVADQNAITVAEAVKKYIEKTKSTLPAGVQIDYYQDMSQMLKSRIELLTKNMGLGLLLVSILLGLFLSLRLAFWVSLGIPISFCFGMMFLPYYDVSINMVSLFAFITVLGIVVDDAIIIGENIFRQQEEGKPRLQASIEGAIEVGLPVIFSVLTTVVAFYPLLLGGGMMGKIMRNLPIVVIAVLMGSLVESLLILPSHLAGRKNLDQPALHPGRKEKLAARALKSFIKGPYTRFLEFCVKWRYATIALGAMVLLLTLGAWTGGIIKFTFMPEVEGDLMHASVNMPVGTPAESTAEIVVRMERAAEEALNELDRDRPAGSEPLFKTSVSLLGLQASRHGAPEFGDHLAQVWIQVLEGEKRDISTAEMTQAWRRKMGPVPEAAKMIYVSELIGAGNAIEAHLSARDNELLLSAVNDLKQQIRAFPGVMDIADSFVPGKQEMQLKLKPAAETLGLSLSDLALQVRHAFYGAESLRLLRDRDEVKVMVRYPESERKSLGYVEDMRIRTAAGDEVPFSQVAKVRMDQGYAAIERAQRRRVVKVTADVDETVTNANEIRGELEKVILPGLVEKYPGLYYTTEGEGKEQKESLMDVFQGFAVAIFCIYALLAVPFKSFTQPFVVMFAIPFGIAGAIIGHLIMGYNLSMISLFGVVGLAGVVVNDSLVLIHAANRIRNQGADSHQAVVQAGRLRFRAILLTSLTTFAGLTPMLLEQSLQARFLVPMAISLGFGVLFGTGITLILIPCLYMVLDDGHNVTARISGWLKPSKKDLPAEGGPT